VRHKVSNVQLWNVQSVDDVSDTGKAVELLDVVATNIDMI